MTSEHMTRFSEEELDKCQSWSLPDVSSEKLIPSAEKEANDREKQRQKNTRLDQNKQTKDDSPKDEIIESADTDLKPLTAEQLQSITETAEKEGYEAGYEKGLEEAKKEGYEVGKKEAITATKDSINQQCANLQHIIDALMIPVQSEQKQLQTILLDMVCQLAKAVVKKELTIDSSQITQLVDAALGTIPPGTDKFSLYLNGQDLALIETYLKENPKIVDKELTYHIDDELLPGGCRLETRQTVIDCSVEKRLNEIIDGFLHKQFSHNDELVDETQADKSITQDSHLDDGKLSSSEGDS